MCTLCHVPWHLVCAFQMMPSHVLWWNQVILEAGKPHLLDCIYIKQIKTSKTKGHGICKCKAVNVTNTFPILS